MQNAGDTITLTAPEWLADWLQGHQGCYADPDARMRLAIELAELNIGRGSGGPFGAVVLDCRSHRLISAGVNRVVACNASIAHAEIMALTTAQQQLARFDLVGCELVSSCEPCAMCFGALPWSGIERLICSARDEDARAIGFDEGPKLTDWQEALQQRGIDVIADIRRAEAAAVLQRYAGKGGAIYNSGCAAQPD
jgi:tRNA(Arg) A34 adenosine deaminase TadA